MIRLMALLATLALAVPTLALAADLGDAAVRVKYRAQAATSAHPGLYPLSWRAKKIRRADRCWRACLADTGREFQACLRVNRSTACVAWNSGANLQCLHECRLSGGPWVRVVE